MRKREVTMQNTLLRRQKTVKDSERDLSPIESLRLKRDASEQIGDRLNKTLDKTLQRILKSLESNTKR